jgi:hypothetical protein
MKKKSLIILSVVAAVVVAGLVSSNFIHWPIDVSKTEGDIGKVDRFSRADKVEELSNMEELLRTDSAYQEAMVMSYALMQLRSEQFASLVDMSNQVAGQIAEYAPLIQKMNGIGKMVNNVNAQLNDVGKQMEKALSGEECPELTQNTINASLAYTQLQKQNALANQFIETTDKYLANAKGSDQLKLVRDQWVDYQKLTAALEANKEDAKALDEKGYLLTSEKAEAALGAHADATQKVMRLNTMICNKLDLSTNLNLVLAGRVTNSEKLGIFCNSEKLNVYFLNTALMSQANAALNFKLPNQLNGFIGHTALGSRPVPPFKEK